MLFFFNESETRKLLTWKLTNILMLFDPHFLIINQDYDKYHKFRTSFKVKTVGYSYNTTQEVRGKNISYLNEIEELN